MCERGPTWQAAGCKSDPQPTCTLWVRTCLQLVRLIHIVGDCIRKHVVTPSRRWTSYVAPQVFVQYLLKVYSRLEKPITLVAWGCSLSLSSLSLPKVCDELIMMIWFLLKVVNFIKSHGLQAPEGNYTKDGAYDLHQVNSALRVNLLSYIVLRFTRPKYLRDQQ